MTDEEPQAEIVINRSSSRDGGIGWSIRLVRDQGTIVAGGSRPAETDDQYTARVITKHRELERELLGKVCCHDLDSCQENVKQGSRQ